MKVLHFILGKANKDRANGVNQVVNGLAKYSGKIGVAVRVIGKSDSCLFEGESYKRDGFNVEVYSRWNNKFFSDLSNAVVWADIVHLHGVYAPWNIPVAFLCKKNKKPYILTLHDGLDPQRSTQRGKLKKWLYHKIIQQSHISGCAAVHVLTEDEATDFFSVASARNVFCVNNGVDLDDFPEFFPSVQIKKNICIGYLGRISEEKNLRALCLAFSSLNSNNNMKLKLAGPESNYGNQLLNEFGEFGVELVGPKYGLDKLNYIKSLDLFVHPSLCDVFSISGMEVLALGVPLLITRTSKASYFYNTNSFFMCEPTVFGLKRGLHEAIKNQDKWLDMVINGRRLIEEKLNWCSVTRVMVNQYNEIVINYA